MKFQESITLTNKLEELHKLAVFIEQLNRKWKIPAKIGMNIDLALEEIITNTIHYGYSDHLPHFINVEFNFNKSVNEIWIKVVDDGNPFNPYSAEIPDVHVTEVAKRKVGGLGIYLAAKLMDKFEYEWIDNKNVLTLRKIIEDNN